MSRKDKLSELADQYGYDTINEMLEEAASNSVVPAICINRDCDYTDQLEPDAEKYECPDCNTNTVNSCLIIAGLI